jgi:hypothetical protein
MRRSRRRTLLEKLILPLLRRRPYRCQRCEHRFYAPVRSASAADAGLAAGRVTSG